MKHPEAPRVPEPQAISTDKLLGNTGVKLRLALASAFVLGAGALLAPRAEPTALSTPQELAAPLLEEQVPLRQSQVAFRGVQDMVARGRDYAVFIGSAPAPPLALVNDYSMVTATPLAGGGFGVFVSSIYILTHAAALDGRTSFDVTIAAGRSVPATVAAYEPSTGLVLLQTPAAERPLPTLAAAAPEVGSLTAGIGRTKGGDVALPVFVTAVARDRFTVGGVQTIGPGLPLYTLEGDLIAIAVGGISGTAYPAADAATRLIARAAAGDRRASLGLSLQDRTGPLATAFGDSGVLVTAVVPGSPSDRADVEPGDVLQAIDDLPIATTQAAAAAVAALKPGAEATLRLVRAGRPRTATVVASLAYEVAALADANVPQRVATGIDGRTIFPIAALEAAGIPLDARLLRVNARTVSTRADALREWRRGRLAAVLLLRHEDRQFFAVLEGAR